MKIETFLSRKELAESLKTTVRHMNNTIGPDNMKRLGIVKNARVFSPWQANEIISIISSAPPTVAAPNAPIAHES
jgi:hypothetical protein